MPSHPNIYLPARDICRHLAIGKLKRIPLDDNPTRPAQLSDARLDELNRQLDEAAEWPTPEVARQLVNHAAWFIMTHWPNARYQRDDGLTHIPNLTSIGVYYRQWPHAIARPPGAPQHPALAYRKPKRDYIPIPEPENRRLWDQRRQAAARYEAEYRQTGVLPPSPRITADTADDTDLLADREGWHDFAAQHPEARGSLYLLDYLTGEDLHQVQVLNAGHGPAVPPATRRNAVQEARAKAPPGRP